MATSAELSQTASDLRSSDIEIDVVFGDAVASLKLIISQSSSFCDHGIPGLHEATQMGGQTLGPIHLAALNFP
jgi:hypothetical protein